MNFSEPFIRRPVGTSLLSIGLLLLGIVAYHFLPVAPLPRVDFPVVQVGAYLPGADPGTMAATVAAPLERQLGQIAGVSEITSVSTAGAASITLVFELSRQVSGALRDVRAAISAARADLPSSLPYPPTARTYSPSDSPILILALTSQQFTTNQLFEYADSVVAQRVSQIEGVSQANIYGASKPAIRIRLDPSMLALSGLGMEDVRLAIAQSNLNLPLGSLDGDTIRFSIDSNDQLEDVKSFEELIVAQRNGVPIKLGQLGTVFDSVENTKVAGWLGTTPAILISVYKQADANVIEAVDGIKALIPQLQSWLPPGVKLQLVSDRTLTIRASVQEVQFSLMLSIGLVILVIFAFLRRLRPTVIASLTVPLALAGTFACMHLLGYSLDNLSLMALTISVGFVVDDAIVVIENIFRYLEQGFSPMEAALKGAKEIGFTVISITVSLVAVFLPLLFMGGLIGRLFHEFAVTLSLAVLASAVISLTLTPCLCALMIRSQLVEAPENMVQRLIEKVLAAVSSLYATSLKWVLGHAFSMLLFALATIAATLWMYGLVPKGFFPQQDTGMLMATVEGSQDISFSALSSIQKQVAALITADKDVASLSGFLGISGLGGTSNSGRMYISLKPLSSGRPPAEQIIGRLRKQTAQIAGARVFILGMQDVRVGGRSSKAQYQYTLQSPDLDLLNETAPVVLSTLRALPQLIDVSSDQQTGGLKMSVRVNRDAAARLGVNMAEVDAALYDAFGQRQISTIFRRFNQNKVVLEFDEESLTNPDALNSVYVRTQSGKLVPLASVARFERSPAQISVNHQGQFPSVTISFNLAPGVSLGQATELVSEAVEGLSIPQSVSGSFQGTAQIFRESLSTLPALTFWAIVVVYLVLGILYESLLHPLTILSTLPSAGLGALLALYYFGHELSMVSFIGIILLMGIVKKNGILIVDFAVDAARQRQLSPREAIFEACIARFRPISMTTLAALFGSLPLAFASGVGSELRRPLGIALVGGLLLSQIVTLYTTPVVYLAFESARAKWIRIRSQLQSG